MSAPAGVALSNARSRRGRGHDRDRAAADRQPARARRHVAVKGSRLSNLLRTTDHKMIGKLYLITSFVVLHRRRPDGAC